VIIMISDDAVPSAMLRAERAGADAVLLKPCLPETLRTEIQRLTNLSGELRERNRSMRKRLPESIADQPVDAPGKQRRKSHAYHRLDTTSPPLVAPWLVCPICDAILRYDRSHVGGVSAAHSEQWDYFTCANGCGTFQYRQRTRKLRHVQV
jgi:hypothetical protein